MSLALQPALADDLFGNHPLTPEARDAFVTELLKKMTVDEKIGQLRLISVGPGTAVCLTLRAWGVPHAG